MRTGLPGRGLVPLQETPETFPPPPPWENTPRSRCLWTRRHTIPDTGPIYTSIWTASLHDEETMCLLFKPLQSGAACYSSLNAPSA